MDMREVMTTAANLPTGHRRKLSSKEVRQGLDAIAKLPIEVIQEVIEHLRALPHRESSEQLFIRTLNEGALLLEVEGKNWADEQLISLYPKLGESRNFGAVLQTVRNQMRAAERNAAKEKPAEPKVAPAPKKKKQAAGPGESSDRSEKLGETTSRVPESKSNDGGSAQMSGAAGAPADPPSVRTADAENMTSAGPQIGLKF